MVKLTERQEKIVAYLRANGTLHKGRYAVKSTVAYAYAQFHELAVLQRIGTVTYSPEQKHYYINAAPPVAPPDEMFAGKRFGGTTPITAEQERLARTRYFDARQVADDLRASARTQALTMAPDGLRQLQNSVERFYEAVEIEARRARELFDLLSDQTYD